MHRSKTSGSVGMLGTRLADLGLRVVGEEPEAVDGRVVVDDERPVGTAMDVELDPVGALISGRTERRERVLERVTRRTPVSEHEREGFPGVHGAERRHGRERPADAGVTGGEGTLRTGVRCDETAGQTPCNAF